MMLIGHLCFALGDAIWRCGEEVAAREQRDANLVLAHIKSKLNQIKHGKVESSN
jgi:hypothetical protein